MKQVMQENPGKETQSWEVQEGSGKAAQSWEVQEGSGKAAQSWEVQEGSGKAILPQKPGESAGELQECLEYFRKRPVFDRVFRAFRGKYKSLGHFGGSITLSLPRMEERMQLEGFLQKNYRQNKTVTLSAGALEKALQSSRYRGLTWEEILEAYFGETLEANRIQSQREEEERQQFFQKIRDDFQGSQEAEAHAPVLDWLSHVLEDKKEGWLLLSQQYKENSGRLAQILPQVLQTAARLPLTIRLSLPVFAADCTGDPHFYDTGSLGERLLTAYLEFHFHPPIPGGGKNAEWRTSLYYQAGILKDDLSNDVLVYGLHAVKQDGEIHQGIEGFLQERQALRLTLNTVGSLAYACPAGISRNPGTVLVVENPAVFAAFVQAYPDSTLVCGNGQLRLATLALLDLLVQNSRIYYAGDYDPEGLLILQRLEERYGERLIPWQYDKGLYEGHLSEVEISSASLKKLDKIHMPKLRDLVEGMRVRKKAAYQETILESLLQAWEVIRDAQEDQWDTQVEQ